MQYYKGMDRSYFIDVYATPSGDLSLTPTAQLATLEQFGRGAVPSGIYRELIAEGPFSANLLDEQIGVDTDLTYFIQGGEGESIKLLTEAAIAYPLLLRESAMSTKLNDFNPFDYATDLERSTDDCLRFADGYECIMSRAGEWCLEPDDREEYSD